MVPRTFFLILLTSAVMVAQYHLNYKCGRFHQPHFGKLLQNYTKERICIILTGCLIFGVNLLLNIYKLVIINFICNTFTHIYACTSTLLSEKTFFLKFTLFLDYE